ncbi:perlucin-like [Ruditapes philippinarum]|uniref:perlucin-like n=1 Tax=Ruditapes philippinarum TaxID=129788 RepID=UPI00295BD490|nr:perlucin-like [Ruditapes philippinarum]
MLLLSTIDKMVLLFISLAILHVQGVIGTDCPDGFEGHHGTCYFFSHGEETWTGAYESCKIFGSMLVEINSADEDLYLSNKARSLGNYYWIGLTDKRVEREYEWETSRELLTDVGYTNWGQSEPDNIGRENCVFYASSRNYKWADAECTRTENYICEKG